MLKHEVFYINKLKKALNKIEDIKAIYMDGVADCFGIPDLLVLDTMDGNYEHIEVKKLDEDLKPNQKAWAYKYSKFIFIARILDDKLWHFNSYVPATATKGKEDALFNYQTLEELVNILKREVSK